MSLEGLGAEGAAVGTPGDTVRQGTGGQRCWAPAPGASGSLVGGGRQEHGVREGGAGGTDGGAGHTFSLGGLEHVT